MKTLLVVAICKPETGTFTEHCAIGKDANWVAKFLKPISRQTPCSLFSAVDCMPWNLPKQEETATSCGSSRCLFFVHLPCCASSVSVSQQSLPSWRIWYCWNAEVKVRHPLLSSTFCTLLKAGLAAHAAWKVTVDSKPLPSENKKVQEPQLASRMGPKEPPLPSYFMK